MIFNLTRKHRSISQGVLLTFFMRGTPLPTCLSPIVKGVFCLMETRVFPLHPHPHPPPTQRPAHYSISKNIFASILSAIQSESHFVGLWFETNGNAKIVLRNFWKIKLHIGIRWHLYVSEQDIKSLVCTFFNVL